MPAIGERASPASSGVTTNSRITPFASAATWFSPATDNSSSPCPCTTQTLSLPRRCKASAIIRVQLGSNTPVNCRVTEAGFANGPNRLKIVRVPSSTRAPPAWRKAAWWRGANMNAQPAASSTAGSRSSATSTFTPSACNTSAAPVLELSARLPCLATFTPAPASTKVTAVEMFKLPDASPPVPTTSIASAGATTRVIRLRIARTAPAISATVSRRTRIAITSPAICAGVASPDMIMPNASSASASLSVAPLATRFSVGFRFPLMSIRPPSPESCGHAPWPENWPTSCGRAHWRCFPDGTARPRSARSDAPIP